MARAVLYPISAVVFAAALAIPLGVIASTKTTTTTYTYNGDGALTEMTVARSSGGTVTTYYSWDNFTPSLSDPSTGTLRAGNGNLLSAGPSPGGSAQNSFDVRNRLTAITSPAAQSYTYDADQMLSEAQLGGDRLSFYYDNSALRRVVNQKQAKTGQTSGHLRAGRYLSDGTEQILMVPRKDTAALYDPAADTVTSYDYSPFGAVAAGGSGAEGGYDLAQNPFQYAGEYRDPVWGGYYLRARWYDPDLPSFISRDPVQNLNRYAYGGGNPVMHVDPSGKDFLHDLGKFNQWLNKGVGGGFARFFLAPMMGPLSILSNPKSFWHAIEHNTANIDVFLALGVLSEGVGGYLDSQAVSDIVVRSRARRYAYRTLSDTGLGIGQSAFAAARHGWHHFDWKTFGKGLEMTGGVSLFWRGLYGANVRTGYHYASGVADIINDFNNNATDGDALVFRVWKKIPGNRFLNNLPLPKDAPLLETFGLGSYHEELVAVKFIDTGVVQRNTTVITQVEEAGLQRGVDGHSPLNATAGRPVFSHGRFEVVGRVANFDANAFFENPLGVTANDPLTAFYAGSGNNEYSWYRNNCHRHAYFIMKGMGLR